MKHVENGNDDGPTNTSVVLAMELEISFCWKSVGELLKMMMMV
jgi:hypothetical protein